MVEAGIVPIRQKGFIGEKKVGMEKGNGRKSRQYLDCVEAVFVDNRFH